MSGCRAAVVILAAVAFLAKSQEGDDTGVPMQGALTPQQLRGIHELMDTDKDGKVSFTEVLEHATEMSKIVASKSMAAVLRGMDADNDGMLSLDELLQGMGHQREHSDGDEKEESMKQIELERQKFKIADTNKDGFLSIEELPSVFFPETHEEVLEVTAKYSLDQKDKDGDGKLSQEEFWETKVGQDPEISDENMKVFEKLDADGDGFLIPAELKVWDSGRFHTVEAMQTMFNFADNDNDMHLSADEIEAARELIADSDAHYHLKEWADHSEL